MGKARGMHGNERNVYIVLARKRTGMTSLREPKFEGRMMLQIGPIEV